MSKYIETPLSAAAYQRCRKITIWNPFMETPTVQFEEEQIIKRANNTLLHDDVGTITKLINKFDETFPVYDPVTQVKTGQDASIAQLYALIWSVYMNEAISRDAHLAKAAVFEAYRQQSYTDKIAMEEAVAAIYRTFDEQDALDLASATALSETKTTQAEKDEVMANYAANKQAASVSANASAQALRDTYATDSAAAEAQSVIDAQAAYDAVMGTAG